MRTATLMTALCVFMLAAGAANAVTYTDSSPQTTAGQDFVFTFSPVNPWNGGNGTFTVHARGDYSVDTSSEYLDWGIDGLVSDRAGPLKGGTVIQTFNYNDVEWEQSFMISGSTLNAITSDSSIAISIDLSSAVNYEIDPSKHFVEVELTYNASGQQCPPPAAPDNPDPRDGAIEVPVGTCLSWNNGSCPNTCDLPNGGFETGIFSPWITITGPGNELRPWSITGAGSGYFSNGFPFEGSSFAQNGFDGDAGLFYDIYQEVAIPACASAAVLNWSERIQWQMAPWGATLPRDYEVSVQPAGGGSPLAVLYARELLPGTDGDTGYVSHSIDLLSVAPGIAGQTVRINFHEYIPEEYTGPAQFDLDGISLNCGGGATPSISGNSLLAQQAGTLDSAALQAKYSRLREAALASQNVEPGLYEYDSSAMNPGGAQAPQGERVVGTGCFTFGGAGEIWSGDSRLRANVITVNAQQTLSEIKMQLTFSGNRDLYFYVFESSNVAGLYIPVLVKVVPTVGIGRSFYSSGPISFVLHPGSYYGIGVAWGAGSSVTYYRNRVTLPVPWDLGMVATHLYSNTGPPYTGPINNTYSLAVYSLELCFGSIPPPCPTTWDVYLGTDPGGLDLVASNLTDPNYCPPSVLEGGTTYFWQVIAKNPSSETPGNLWTFETEGGDPPNCNNAVPSVAEIWPPRHEWVDIEILDVNDPDGDPVSITITGITQDEPVAGHGSGRTSPDGMGVGTSLAHVRAERSGQSGSCRVYEISFEADDGTGNTCNGSVKVCVPHDQEQGHECVDDGQLYDSTATEMFSADLNGDGIINQLDFNILARYWLVSYELED